ncbi:hypothetical protein DB88DRAFT_496989 [Papiliotrema laurentii]|uniref:Protein ZIP4 homolog n=1 Tax=Papiliotrema laurentii TaxID=5418 RepID=A0AAD9CWL0_PAPLA|nr:hypothetical protein DB88DRAFT_496989 [Papiliotrema laurentii]
MSHDEYQAIRDAVDTLNLYLDGLPITKTASESRIQEVRVALAQLMGVVERYTTEKKKSGRKTRLGEGDTRSSDWLDMEGVRVWTAATAATKTAQEGGLEEDENIAASMRVAGFRLVEAALEGNFPPPQQVCCRNLHMICRTVSALLKTSDDRALASELLIIGADYEHIMKHSAPRSEADSQDRTKALLDFYLARVETAVVDDNLEIALSFIDKILGTDETLDLNLSHLRRVATLCWETGETARIKLSAKRAEISQELSADSVTKKSCASAFSEEDEGTVIAFFKKAETIVDLMSSMKGGATLPEFEALKLSILKSQTRVYLASQDKERQILGRSMLELIRGASRSTEEAAYELAVLRLHSLEKQGNVVSEDERKDAIQAMIDHTRWNDKEVLSTLSEVHGIRDMALCHWANHALLQSALRDPRGHAFVGNILLTLLVAIRKVPAERQDVCLQTVTNAFKAIDQARLFELGDRAKEAACATMLWHIGGDLFDKGKFREASSWYKLSAHPCLARANDNSKDRSNRKAALCCIRAGNYAQAAEYLGQCSPHDAATHYVSFLSAVEQGEPLWDLQLAFLVMSRT